MPTQRRLFAVLALLLSGCEWYDLTQEWDAWEDPKGFQVWCPKPLGAPRAARPGEYAGQCLCRATVDAGCSSVPLPETEFTGVTPYQS